MSLKEKTIKSLFWIYLFKGLWLIINFGRSVVLARLLFPNDFAIIGLATTFIYFIEQLFTFGFSKILIYKQNITQEELDTAFSLNLIQNIVFFTIIYFCAPYVADFYHKPILELVVRILGFEILMQCIGFIPRVILQKEMKFKEIATIDFITKLLATFLLMYLAFTGWGFWSLVCASLLSNLLKSVTYLYISDLRVHVYFNKEIIQEFLGYSSILYATAILTYLSNSLDIIIIGKLSGMTILGYYTITKQWAKYFHNNFFALLNQVLFPSYAKLQNHKEDLKNAVLKVIRFMFPIILPIYVGFAFVADEFVYIVLSAKWAPIIFPLRILLVAMLVESLCWFLLPVSDAIGKFSIKLKQKMLVILLMVPLMFACGEHYGLNAYVITILIVNIFSFLYAYYSICLGALGITLQEIFFNVGGSIKLVFLMLVALKLSDYVIFTGNVSIYKLVMKVLLGVLFYVVGLYFIHKKLFKEYFELFIVGVTKK